MLRTDLDTPLLTLPASTEKTPSRFIRLTCSGILVITCTIFGFTQTYAQDVAGAARQEQARKQDQQKKPKHVYTDEDLHRAQILTPEDLAEVAAKKKQQPMPGAVEPQEAFDAEALPADLPLGDVARRYRRMRELVQLQQSAEFHLPFADEPVLATPKPSAPIAPEFSAPTAGKHPVAHPVISIPAPPRIEPYHPPVKRSPFERPRVFFSAPSPSAPSQPSAKRVLPPKPPAPSGKPAQPSTIPVAPFNPSAPAPRRIEMPAPRLAPRLTPAEPAAPAVHATPSHRSVLIGAPSNPSAPAPDLRVMPAPKPMLRATPEDPSAPIVRATPSHSALPLASPVKPVAPIPDFSMMPSPHVAPRATRKDPPAPVFRGSPAKPSGVLIAPSQPPSPVTELTPAQPPVVVVAPASPSPAVIPTAPAPAKLNRLIVKPGDSLWKIAQENLGEGIRWPELLAVNPRIVDANHIVAGSQVYLPVADASARASEIIVRKGDTLSKIAQARLGHASWWSCIAQANPRIRDANVILEGQQVFIPTACKP